MAHENFSQEHRKFGVRKMYVARLSPNSPGSNLGPAQSGPFQWRAEKQLWGQLLPHEGSNGNKGRTITHKREQTAGLVHNKWLGNLGPKFTAKNPPKERGAPNNKFCKQDGATPTQGGQPKHTLTRYITQPLKKNKNKLTPPEIPKLGQSHLQLLKRQNTG